MEGADTSNLMATNQENVYEDLTVNTQQADFAQTNSSKQGMANTMDAHCKVPQVVPVSPH